MADKGDKARAVELFGAVLEGVPRLRAGPHGHGEGRAVNVIGQS